MRLGRLVVGLAVLLANSPVSEVTFDGDTVGDPGNAADITGYGTVANVCRFNRYETTSGQYAEFLNSVAATDALNEEVCGVS